MSRLKGSPKVVVIGAWDRSGSTILANLLGTADGIVSVGEVNNLWQRGAADDRPCGCGEPFSRCEFWRPVMSEAFGDRSTRLVETTAAHDRLGNLTMLLGGITGRSQRDIARYAEGLGRLYRAIAARSGAAVIVDSAKKPWHLAIAATLPEVEVYVLHLVRDPRGVVHSLRKTASYDLDVTRPRQLDRIGTTFTALGWRYRNLLLAAGGRRHPRYRRLHYEQFAAAPRREVSEILKWLGQRDDALAVNDDGTVSLPVNHSVSGNPVRFRRGVTPIAVDDEWRTGLGMGRRLLVDTLTWPMLTRYGYDL